MEIKTKFDIGDKMWVMKDDKPCEAQILRVEFHIEAEIDYIDYGSSSQLIIKKPLIRYKLSNRTWINELDYDKRFFKTKGELINSL